MMWSVKVRAVFIYLFEAQAFLCATIPYPPKNNGSVLSERPPQPPKNNGAARIAKTEARCLTAYINGVASAHSMKAEISLGFVSERFVASSQATVVASSKTAAKKAIE